MGCAGCAAVRAVVEAAGGAVVRIGLAFPPIAEAFRTSPLFIEAFDVERVDFLFAKFHSR